MAQPQTTPQDHLAKAREYIAIAESEDSKREAYMAAAREILAARDDDWTVAAIAREVGKSRPWVAEVVAWATERNFSGTPFSGRTEVNAGADRARTKSTLRDPEQRRQTFAQMDDDELRQTADDALRTRHQRRRSQAGEHAPSEPERKANEADAHEQLAEPTMKALGQMISPDAYIESAIDTMQLVEEKGLTLPNYEECQRLTLDLVEHMWRYGAMRGFDVSKLSEAAARLREDES